MSYKKERQYFHLLEHPIKAWYSFCHQMKILVYSFLFRCFYSFPRKYVVVWVIVTYYEVLISFVFKVQHYYTTNPGLILLVCEQNHNTYEKLLILCIFYVMSFPWLGRIIQVREQKRIYFSKILKFMSMRMKIHVQKAIWRFNHQIPNVISVSFILWISNINVI